MGCNFYVYGLYAKDRPTGLLFYIGKGKNLRLFKHYVNSNKSHKRNIILKYKTYPMIIQGGLTEKFAFELEKCLILLYKSSLANKTSGGEGTSGYRHTNETKEKMCHRMHSEQTKLKIGLASKNRKPNLGKKCTDAHKTKISEALIGRAAPNKGVFKFALNFIFYHFWAQSISNLSQKEYCRSQIFSYKAFRTFKHKHYAAYLQTQSSKSY